MLELARGQIGPTVSAAVRIAAGEARGLLRLKSWRPESVTAGRPVVLAGRRLPAEVGATLAGPLRVLCLGPAEWLVISRERAGSRLREQFEPEAIEQGLALVDLSDGLAGLDVQGAAARDLLSKGCGLDLHPRYFAAGQCARTRFAQIPVVIDCLDEAPRFALYVARSYRQYLHAWLSDAAAEFQGTLT